MVYICHVNPCPNVVFCTSNSSSSSIMALEMGVVAFMIHCIVLQVSVGKCVTIKCSTPFIAIHNNH